MKVQITTTAFLLAIIFCCMPISSFAIMEVKPNSKTIETPTTKQKSFDKLELEQLLGRKLTLKERLLWPILQRKINRKLAKLGEKCAQIVLKNGDIIEANIIQINPKELKYKRCNQPDDPEITLDTKDVLSVKAADGDMIFRNTNDSDKKTNPLALAGMITGILGLALSFSLLGLLCGIAGIILSIIGLRQIRKNPEKYKGKGYAITGLICGGVALIIYSFVITLLILINL